MAVTVVAFVVVAFTVVAFTVAFTIAVVTAVMTVIAGVGALLVVSVPRRARAVRTLANRDGGAPDSKGTEHHHEGRNPHPCTSRHGQLLLGRTDPNTAPRTVSTNKSL